MNAVNHYIVIAMFKASQYSKVNINHTYFEEEIKKFVNNFFHYEDMGEDAKEAFDKMYEECIDLDFIQERLTLLLNEENE